MKWLFIALLYMPSVGLTAPSIQVEGLFKGGAILRIDGQQKMLRQGEVSASGVRVIEATTMQVVLEVEGRRQTLTLSQHISAAKTVQQTPSVEINRDQNNRYLTYATINGKRTVVLVDTGANIVALSGQDAKALGINYRLGVQSKVVTASGVMPSYSLVLSSVTVGPITVSGVKATVIEGAFPETVLLGMSYLSKVDMNEKNGVMTLRRKY